jgi:Skp family chaperone for outer membrane proteins
MRQHIRLFALIAVAAVGLAGFARAQAAAQAPAQAPAPAQEGTKMGMINSQEVLEKSVEGKKAIAQLQAADKKYSDQVTQLDDQIKQLQNRLSTQRLTLTQEAAAGIQADIQRKQTDRQRTAEDASRSMQDLQSTLLLRIQNEVMPIIEQVRKDKGLDLIFDLNRSGTVYFNPALDMTDEVVKRYDASKATAPAPPVKK